MTDINSSPVTLAGSHDYDDLKAGLDKAAKGSAKNYDDAVNKALTSAMSPVADAPVDPRSIPGYKFVAVENKDLGVTESVQVFDAKLAEKQDTQPTDGRSEASLVTTQAERVADAAAKA